MEGRTLSQGNSFHKEPLWSNCVLLVAWNENLAARQPVWNELSIPALNPLKKSHDKETKATCNYYSLPFKIKKRKKENSLFVYLLSFYYKAIECL